MNHFHRSVLLQEVLEFLKPRERSRYIDATIGGGGHAAELIKKGGEVLGIDQDEEAIEYIQKQLKVERLKLKVIRGNFRDIDKIAKDEGFEKVDGILFDLGVSSHQLDTKERGFSFREDAPLDMRMDPSPGSGQAVTAADLINGLTKGELYELFTKLGEEHYAHAILKRIIRARGVKPIQTTLELSQIIESVYRKSASIHPATKVFQALRIAVNDELNALKVALPKAVDLLKTGGRLVVISFHSLEDRIVKHMFLTFEENGLGKIITNKPIVPGSKEVEDNTRSRSAKLRVFEKL